MQISTIPSFSNTLMLSRPVTASFLKEFRKEQISVTLFNFDNNNFIRIAVQDEQMNKKFINKLIKIKRKHKLKIFTDK